MRLTLPGWTEDPPKEKLRSWRNVNNEGLTLGLFAQPPQCIESRNELEIRKWARALAESRSAGLIEVRLTDVETRIVFKELEMPTYYYTGVLITRVNGVTAHWNDRL